MAKDDWYRGPIWDLATREQFEQRLSRARTQRAQYLRIKGYELTQADDRSVWAAGRGLLQRVLDAHPDDDLSVIEAHHDLGRSFAREGAYTEAAHHYEQSLALQRQRGGGVDPGTRLTLAELIVDVLSNTQPAAAASGPSKAKYKLADGTADRVHAAAAEMLAANPLYPGLTL